MHEQKLSLPWGASPHVFAQPSKQQSPLLGQSVSLCPGDQQVDTAPCIQLINICPGDQQVEQLLVLHKLIFVSGMYG